MSQTLVLQQEPSAWLSAWFLEIISHLNAFLAFINLLNCYELFPPILLVIMYRNWYLLFFLTSRQACHRWWDILMTLSEKYMILYMKSFTWRFLMIKFHLEFSLFSKMYSMHLLKGKRLQQICWITGDMILDNKLLFDALLGNQHARLTKPVFLSLYKLRRLEEGLKSRGGKEDSTIFCFKRLNTVSWNGKCIFWTRKLNVQCWARRPKLSISVVQHTLSQNFSRTRALATVSVLTHQHVGYICLC